LCTGELSVQLTFNYTSPAATPSILRERNWAGNGLSQLQATSHNISITCVHVSWTTSWNSCVHNSAASDWMLQFLDAGVYLPVTFTVYLNCPVPPTTAARLLQWSAITLTPWLDFCRGQGASHRRNPVYDLTNIDVIHTRGGWITNAKKVVFGKW
jgi:hypothetical protein